MQSKRGPLVCTVTGVVAAGMIPVSFISPAVKDHFEVDDPASIIIFPHAGIDRDALQADLQAIDAKYGDDEAMIDIRAGAVLRGALPRHALSLVEE